MKWTIMSMYATMKFYRKVWLMYWIGNEWECDHHEYNNNELEDECNNEVELINLSRYRIEKEWYDEYF